MNDADIRDNITREPTARRCAGRPDNRQMWMNLSMIAQGESRG